MDRTRAFVRKWRGVSIRAVQIGRFSTTLCVSLLACVGVVYAQAPQTPGVGTAATGRGAFDMTPPVIRLWDGDAPGAVGDSAADIPTLTVFRASGAGVRAAVIVAPGGGYTSLAITYEGRDVATWLNSVGLTAFVLKYRLAPYHYPIELEDAQRAIRLVRSRAADFGIDPEKIGMMGFSAGGHLAATAGTHFDVGNSTAPDPIDRASSRPDFLVLAYPLISFQPDVVGATDVPHAIGSSERNLLGDNPDPKLVQNLSDELQVTPQTPPTFLYHSSSDATVPVASSVAFYLALHKAGVPAELHVFEKGHHGDGLNLGDPANGLWPSLLVNWLRGRGLLVSTLTK